MFTFICLKLNKTVGNNLFCLYFHFFKLLFLSVLKFLSITGMVQSFHVCRILNYLFTISTNATTCEAAAPVLVLSHRLFALL